MGIKAILRKNTPEIRQRIKDMGIKCTNSSWPVLLYIEKNGYVTWGSDECGFDCGENEELFFYLLSLRTEDDDVLKTQLHSVQREYNNLKDQFDSVYELYVKYSDQYNSVICGIKESLDTIESGNSLLKEIQQLQEKIEKLEKENKTLKKKYND